MKRLLMIGSGVSTVSLLKNLIAKNNITVLSIDIIDSEPHFGRGNAYIRDSEHLLSNVPVNEMALDDDENHLGDWLNKKGIQYERFCTRRAFGQYMNDILSDIINRHENINYTYGRVHRLDYDGDCFSAWINGTEVNYDYVYLGIGMLEYADPYNLKGEENFIYNPYPVAKVLKNIEGEVAIVGSGLSAIDSLRYLIKAQNYKTVYMFSRNKDMPSVRGESHSFIFKHFTPAALDSLITKDLLKLEDVKSLFLKEAEFQGIDLSLFERKTGRIIEDLTYDLEHPKAVGKLEYFLIEFNHVFTKYLHKLSEEDRQYMMEHYQPYISENYSPMPDLVAQDLVDWLSEGRLVMMENLKEIEHNDRYILKTDEDAYEMDVVINATGPNTDISLSGNPLIKHLLKQQIISPHHLGGFTVDSDYHVVSPRYGTIRGMFALGELTFGMTYLSNSVFDIYEMSKEIADEILETI